MKLVFSFLINRPKLAFFLAISWTVIIFIGCSLPGNDLPKLTIFNHFDKVVHFTFFTVFFILWFINNCKSITNAIILLVISSLFGLGIEFYQLYFVAGRSFDIWDAVFDSLGAVFGLWIVKSFRIKE